MYGNDNFSKQLKFDLQEIETITLDKDKGFCRCSAYLVAKGLGMQNKMRLIFDIEKNHGSNSFEISRLRIS
jgi:hypothetical protein